MINLEKKLVALIFVVLLIGLGGGYGLGFAIGQHQISMLRTEYNSAKAKYDELTVDYADLNETYRELQTDYAQLQSNYTDLNGEYGALNETYQSLLFNYTSLDEEHQVLIIEYNKLNESYNMLIINYTTLQEDYDHLSSEYHFLFSDYNALVKAFNDPLSYGVIPTTHELELWLEEDEIDKIWYEDPNFVCGDFAVMLSQHAKLEHWDMGVVGIFGYDENYESYDHAFNAIVCTEGLVYIEPQTDDLWGYTDHEEISEGIWWEFPEVGNVYVEDYIVILLYN